MSSTEAARDLALAVDPVRFAEAVGMTPDPWQARVLRSTAKRLLLNCSRQSGKSTTTAVVGLHRAIYYPNSTILLVSPSARQSSELFRKVTDALDVLPGAPDRVEDNKLSLELTNGSRVVSLPSSEDTIRGYSGVDLIIEDEAAFVDDAVNAAIRPMLAVSGGRLIVMSTPYGKRGHFFDAWTQPGDGWEKIQIRATDCPRITAAFLEGEKHDLGEWRFRQEYECEFVETVDAVFTHEQINTALSDDVAPMRFGEAA